MSRKRTYQERIDELMKRKKDCDEKSKQLNKVYPLSRTFFKTEQ